MKLLLTSAYEFHEGLDTVLQYAELDDIKQHTLCDEPDDADAIVFVENTQFDDVLFKRLSQHEWVNKYSDKVYMYNEMDRPWDLLPGLYTSMEKSKSNQQRHRAFAYLSTPNSIIRDVYDRDQERRWLYSFMGSMSHACRRPIMRLRHENGYLKDTSEFDVWNTTTQELRNRSEQYATIMGESMFVLCPRGIGTSSIRLYETMESGRAPVIISDQWTPPLETDWSFAIQVSEKKIASIPGLLSAMENEAIERGEAARAAWLDSYAPNTMFDLFASAIESLSQNELTHAPAGSGFHWNKWIATSSLFTRTTVQRIRGQR